jgi:hypothetical protein
MFLDRETKGVVFCVPGDKHFIKSEFKNIELFINVSKKFICKSKQQYVYEIFIEEIIGKIKEKTIDEYDCCYFDTESFSVTFNETELRLKANFQFKGE